MIAIQFNNKNFIQLLFIKNKDYDNIQIRFAVSVQEIIAMFRQMTVFISFTYVAIILAVSSYFYFGKTTQRGFVCDLHALGTSIRHQVSFLLGSCINEKRYFCTT